MREDPITWTISLTHVKPARGKSEASNNQARTSQAKGTSTQPHGGWRRHRSQSYFIAYKVPPPWPVLPLPSFLSQLHSHIAFQFWHFASSTSLYNPSQVHYSTHKYLEKCSSRSSPSLPSQQLPQPNSHPWLQVSSMASSLRSTMKSRVWSQQIPVPESLVIFSHPQEYVILLSCTALEHWHYILSRILIVLTFHT